MEAPPAPGGLRILLISDFGLTMEQLRCPSRTINGVTLNSFNPYFVPMGRQIFCYAFSTHITPLMGRKNGYFIR